MNRLSSGLVVGPALPEERNEAVRLLFQRDPEPERATRIANANALLGRNELNPDGLWVARRGHDLAGTLLCLPISGSSALLWPPQVALEAPQPEVIEDQLLAAARRWLKGQGAKLTQSLLTAIEAPGAAALVRNGFHFVTRLWFMRCDLDSGPMTSAPGLRFDRYPDCDPALFQNTLLATYEATLDCPEVTGVRTGAQVIEGHRAQGIHHPSCWWLVRADDQIIGVLLLAEMPESRSWDLSYLGLIATARGRGYGKALVAHALNTVRQRSASCLTLSVDRRNHPAIRLYRQVGFHPFDERDVYLFIG